MKFEGIAFSALVNGVKNLFGWKEEPPKKKKTINPDEVPKTLDEAIEILKRLNGIDQFKAMSEKEIVSFHMTIGMSIRNNWGFWNPNKNELVQYFNSIGIEHGDDMSSVVITSLHRDLNGKDRDLEGQIAVFKAHWDKYGT